MMGDKQKIDPALPKPSNVRTMSDRNSVGFEWEYPNNPSVEGYKIYRGSGAAASELAGVAKDRFASHFVDSELKEDTTYTYRLSSYTKEGYESEATAVINVKTAPALEPVSFIAAVNNLPSRGKIVWRPHVSPDVVGYIVQKSGVSDKNWQEVAKINSRLMSEYIDKEVESGRIYYYRVIAKTFDGGYSKPSQTVIVNTKNTPVTALSLTATKELVKQIKVEWAHTAQKEFLGYKLYRADSSASAYSLVYSGKENKYIDAIGSDGEIRYYKATIVDKDALESPIEQALAVVGSTKAIPATPAFTLAVIKDNKVRLEWSASKDGALTYKITKKWGNLLNRQIVTYTDIKGGNFEDKEIDLGVKYLYSIEAIDKDSLASKASDDVELFVPKGM